MLGLLFGLLASLQYIVPGIGKEWLSFEQLRPLHVSSVIFWIILCAAGISGHFMSEFTGHQKQQNSLKRLQYYLFAISISAILVCYLMGLFGGREYWEYPPLLSIPLGMAWLLFMISMIRQSRHFFRQPVYVWMWFTGVFSFLFTFSESYLWLIPSLRGRVIQDITLQWKSNGSMVGSWNMLIYGSSIYLMDKLAPNKKYGYSRIAFLMYLLGLTNLMFNWGHHIYTVPARPFIRPVSYIVSMSEWIILARMIRMFRKSMKENRNYLSVPGFRFLMASEYWILANLALAIFMSVPALNLYTHGTHMTVAHAMGSTIGINTMLLLGMVVYVMSGNTARQRTTLKYGFWITQISLMIFWFSLIIAGLIKAVWQMGNQLKPFQTMMEDARPAFILFVLSGTGLVIGLYFIIIPIIRGSLTGRIVPANDKESNKLLNPD